MGLIHLFGKNDENFQSFLPKSLWANAAQISYEPSLGRGTKGCENGCSPLTKMAAMLRYGKSL